MPYTLTIHTKERDELMIALTARRDYLARMADAACFEQARHSFNMRHLYVDGMLQMLREAQPGVPVRLSTEGLEQG